MNTLRLKTPTVFKGGCMVAIINEGFCVKCKCWITNEADGRQRPLCHDCEQELNEIISKGSVGEKHKKGALVYPPARDNMED